MKSALNIKRPRLYLFLGVIFLLLMTLSYVSEYADTILERTVNNVWRLPYVIALHYTIFEFAFPFIARKKRDYPAEHSYCYTHRICVLRALLLWAVCVETVRHWYWYLYALPNQQY